MSASSISNGGNIIIWRQLKAAKTANGGGIGVSAAQRERNGINGINRINEEESIKSKKIINRPGENEEISINIISEMAKAIFEETVACEKSISGVIEIISSSAWQNNIEKSMALKT
jgi:hypothetical protein